jgi:hypothetical protein
VREGQDHLEGLDADGKIMSKLIIKEQDEWVGSGLIHLRIRTNGGLL